MSSSVTTPERPSGRTTRRRRIRSIGPGALVAAAFVGPGTVTTATLAGVRYGYSLLWALGFSIVATLVLQEMAARLGLVTGGGLGEAVRRRFTAPVGRAAAVGLVIAAVAFGNAAYETGNLLGAGLGAEAVIGGAPRYWAAGIASVVFLLLWSGSYRVVERVLLGMVVLMSVVFLATAVVIAPALGPVLEGLFVPSLPADGDAGLMVVVGLIGTTVVPYNLFLHAAAVRERWDGPESLGPARTDLGVTIAIGGMVTLAIVVSSAAVAAGGDIANAADMALQLEPLLGSWARIFFATGLLAAGITSATTAPLAAAYATAGALGWRRDLRSPKLRAVWMLVLAAGVLFALTGVRPVPAILFAQVANGILLPAVAIFLLLATSDRRWMGRWRNHWVVNVLGGLVALIALVLGARAVVGVFS